MEHRTDVRFLPKQVATADKLQTTELVAGVLYKKSNCMSRDLTTKFSFIWHKIVFLEINCRL
jgi:hypothetical protein